MSSLPNAVLLRRENAAAARAATTERAIECAEVRATAARDSDEGSQSDEEGTDWRSVSLALTSRDMLKGRRVSTPRDRVAFACMLTAPLLVASVILIALAAVIWTGTAQAGNSAVALTGALLTEVATAQAVHYTLLSATLSDGGAAASAAGASISGWAAVAQARAAGRIDEMFSGAYSSGVTDAAAVAALGAVHHGDLCSVLVLSEAELARCGALAGGACHSGLKTTMGAMLWSAEALSAALSHLALSASPLSPTEVAALRAVMDAQYVTDMRVMLRVEAAAAMAADAGVRQGLVQAAADSASGTATTLAVVLIVGAVLYEVCVCLRLTSSRGLPHTGTLGAASSNCTVVPR